MVHIGIDIGVSGAIAAVSDKREFLGVRDMPIVQRGTFKFVDGPRLLTILSEIRNGAPATVILEYAGFTKSAQAASGMGRNLGGCVATVMLAALPLDIVTPQKWKKHFGLIDRNATDKERKNLSRSIAVMKYPAVTDLLERVKDHNRAEAILLAEYSRMVSVLGGAA